MAYVELGQRDGCVLLDPLLPLMMTGDRSQSSTLLEMIPLIGMVVGWVLFFVCPLHHGKGHA